MQRVGIYILILVIGALIGASSVTFVALNNNQLMYDQVEVTIQEITYKESENILEITVLNDALEKNLQGQITLAQNENQWSSPVNWNYTGYGKAEKKNEKINQN
jgi:hypothetical protein